MTTTGVIGLGVIGSSLARHLRKADQPVVVCDVRPEAVAVLTDRGATAAATPAEVAAAADVISVVVLDDAQVLDVVAGSGGILEAAAPGTVIAVHSTISVETAVELGRLAGERGVHVVDAPVSGGPSGARNGTLVVMAGGDADAVARCGQAFEPWSSLVLHVGPLGAGTKMKLARNLLHYVAFTAVGEAQRLAEAVGVDLLALGEVVRASDELTGGAGSVMMRSDTSPLAPGDGLYEVFGHVRDLGEKDLDLALAMAAEHGIDLPLAALARTELAAALGVPHDDDGDHA